MLNIPGAYPDKAASKPQQQPATEVAAAAGVAGSSGTQPSTSRFALVSSKSRPGSSCYGPTRTGSSTGTSTTLRLQVLLQVLVAVIVV